MFTGIIKDTGVINSLDVVGPGKRFSISSNFLFNEIVQVGDSIAIDGCCLTIERIERDKFTFFISNETLSKTNLSALEVGDRVNIEPALRLQDRIGGHLVSGHVDGVGAVIDVRKEGESLRVEFSFPEEFSKYIVNKGSITIDGISLTTCEVDKNTFCVYVIPHTINQTQPRTWKVGSKINLEIDTIARYLEKLTLFGESN